MEEKEMICIACPIGCRITIQARNNKIISAQGNRCPRGIKYIEHEYFNPLRILTTTVQVINGEFPYVSVKTEKAIPKGMLKRAMFDIANIKAKAPLRVGETIVGNLSGTGIRLIATRNVKRKF